MSIGVVLVVAGLGLASIGGVVQMSVREVPAAATVALFLAAALATVVGLVLASYGAVHKQGMVRDATAAELARQAERRAEWDKRETERLVRIAKRHNIPLKKPAKGSVKKKSEAAGRQQLTAKNSNGRQHGQVKPGAPTSPWPGGVKPRLEGDADE